MTFHPSCEGVTDHIATSLIPYGHWREFFRARTASKSYGLSSSINHVTKKPRLGNGRIQQEIFLPDTYVNKFVGTLP